MTTVNEDVDEIDSDLQGILEQAKRTILDGSTCG